MPHVPDGITVTLAIPEDRVARQDAAFYVDLFDAVAEVGLADASRVITVRCVGDMKIILWKSEDCDRGDEDNIVAVIRNSDDLIAAGIASDEKLQEFEDHIEWENNPWFELFDSNDEAFHDLGEVYHDLDDAIGGAIKVLLGTAS
jgi:hypothetical protein